MKKTFSVNCHNVEFTPCTAIVDGDTERQKAVFIHDTTDEFGNGDGVVFGVSVPNSEKDATSLLEEYVETDSEILKTVIFCKDTIREHRKSQNLTLHQLSAMSGVSVTQIHAVETGKSDPGNMSARNLLAIAKALNVDPYEII